MWLVIQSLIQLAGNDVERIPTQEEKSHVLKVWLTSIVDGEHSVDVKTAGYILWDLVAHRVVE